MNANFPAKGALIGASAATSIMHTMTTKTRHMTALTLAGMSFILASQLPAQTPEQARIKELEAKIKALEASAQPATATAQPSATAAPAATAQAPASEYKKGLWLNFWLPKDKPLETDIPDWGETGSVVVTKQPFTLDPIKNDPDFKKYYSQPYFFGLDGYIKITNPGVHTLTVDVEQIVKEGALAHEVSGNATGGVSLQKYSIYLQGDCLVRSESREIGRNKSTSINVDTELDPGMYRLQVPFDFLTPIWHYKNNIGPQYFSGLRITVTLKEPGSRRPRVLTDEDLFHKE